MSEIRKIENFAAPELDVYARLSEPQLLHYYEPQPGLFLAESPRVIERALDAGYEPVSFLAGSAELAANEALFAHCPDAPVYTAETKVLEQLTGFALTRGMLCAMHRRTLPAMEEICRNARRVAILENVVNPTNVGAIFRSAAALGIDAVLLTSGCSNPLYRRAIRVSMGTVFQVPWAYLPDEHWQSLVHDNGFESVAMALREDAKVLWTVLPGGSYWPEQGIAALQELGFYTVAMALKEDSVPMDDPSLKTHEKLAILLGTEGDGLASDTIAETDATVLIPMTHGVDSLNVAAASAVAFWELAGRR